MNKMLRRLLELERLGGEKYGGRRGVAYTTWKLFRARGCFRELPVQASGVLPNAWRLHEVFSVWLTRRLAREARGNKLLPVMVFYRGAELKWILKNVGEGTALNVSILNYSGDHLKDELELYPVAPGQQIKLDYLQGADKLIANYVNIYGEDPHHTICAMNDNGLKAGRFVGKTAGSFSRGHESEIDKWPLTRL